MKKRVKTKKKVIKGDVCGDVGFRMKKGKVVVKGDVYGGVGFCMKGGKLLVEGMVRCPMSVPPALKKKDRSAKEKFSEIKVKPGEELTIEGDVVGSIGRGMEGSTVIVKGDIYDIMVGTYMEGGTILVKGGIDSCVGVGDFMKGGTITVAVCEVPPSDSKKKKKK